MASIGLFVGHGTTTEGNWDCGCTDGSYNEADLMYNIVGYAVPILRHYGVVVLTDFDTGNDRNCTYTIRDANAAGVDAYVSLHCDYYKAASGTLPIIYPGSDAGAALASAINAAVLARINIPSRGIISRDDMEVSNTNMPACIFETGSIRADINVLLEPRPYGEAIAFGILDYFGIAYDGTSDPVPSQPEPQEAYAWDTWNVQYWANICNYGAPEIDGEWGPETEGCVKMGQGAYHIAVDGLWGHVTEGAASGQIRAYQEALNRHGYACAIDGIAGPETYGAVQSFQAANGLESDGIVGELTYPVLMG